MRETILKSFISFITLLIIHDFAAAQKIDLIFSHKFHYEQDLGCADCHPAADTSQLASDNLLPGKKTCFNCHEEKECQLCHRNPAEATFYPRIIDYIAFFPHQKHVTPEKPNCGTCHAGVECSQNILERHLPKMTSCTHCHDDRANPDYCNFCHQPKEDLLPFDHRHADWQQQHGLASQTDLIACVVCHTTNACIECHQGDNLDRKVHRLNYRFQHGLMARGNKTTCITCHEEAAFCNACHRNQMVYPRSHATANWSNRTTGGRHAHAAKLDLDICISCHAASKTEPVCVQCHHK